MSLCNSKLAPIISYVALYLVVSLITLQLEAAKPHSRERMKGIRSIQAKLDYFTRRLSDYPELDYFELYDVSREFEAWRLREKNGIRSLPDLRLVDDCAIAPMKKIALDKPEKIMEQIKKCYRFFKPAYLSGKQARLPYIEPEAPHNRKLLQELLQGSNGSPVYEDFVAGRSEALKLLNRMNELSDRGTMYDNFEEFTGLVNFFNDNLYKALFINVYPSMKRATNLQALKSRFEKNFPLYGWDYVHGKWRESKRPPVGDHMKLAGFMYVI